MTAVAIWAVGGILFAALLAPLAVPVLSVLGSLHFGQAVSPAAHDYPAAAAAPCPEGVRPGPSGDLSGKEAGIGYAVRTPANYDARFAHPLLVVFAPAGLDAWLNERFTGLTRVATAAGFIVAYVDHRRPGMEITRSMGRVVAEVVRGWCIDPARVYYAGHSDGGTMAMAMAFTRVHDMQPAGFIASAAGIRDRDLNGQACPAPTAAMVVHGRQDSLFPLPEYGAKVAHWWAACNGCTIDQTQPLGDGCHAYAACASGAPTVYCEHPGGHRDWPPMGALMLEFLQDAGAAHTIPPTGADR